MTEQTNESSNEPLEQHEQQPAAPQPDADVRARVEARAPVSPEPEPIETQDDDRASEHDTPVGERAALTLPADLPASAVPDDFQDQLDDFNAAASEAGLDGRTAQRLLNAMIESGLDSPVTSSYEYSTDEAADEMERRWGADYERRIALVRQSVKKLGIDEYLDRTGRGNDPACLEAIYLYASGDLTLSKSEAQKRLDKILQDPKHAYWNKNVGSHERKKIVSEVRRLTQIANETDTPVKARAWQPPKPSAQESAKASVRAELAELAKKKSLSPDERKTFILLTARL